MGPDEQPPPAGEQIVRSRAFIATSRESIARSREHIRDSLLVLARSVGGFEAVKTALSDDDLAGATERFQAQMQQREIEREMRRTGKETFNRIGDLLPLNISS